MNYANVFDPKINHYLPSHAKVSATHSNFLQVPSTGKHKLKSGFLRTGTRAGEQQENSK